MKQIRDNVTLRGIPCIVIGINLTDNDQLFYIVRDEQNRSHHAYPSELT